MTTNQFDLAAELVKKTARIMELEEELNLRRKSGSASERLHNLCEGIARDADGSEWSREEWESLDAKMLDQTKQIAELKTKVEELAKFGRDAHNAAIGWMAQAKSLQALLKQRDGNTTEEDAENKQDANKYSTDLDDCTKRLGNRQQPD